MRTRTRQAVAFVVGRLISHSGSDIVYDHERGESVVFSGSVEEDRIRLRDCLSGSDITGWRDGGCLFLYHAGDESGLTLNVARDRFEGCDEQEGFSFSGCVSGSSILLYDGEYGRHFSFTL